MIRFLCSAFFVIFINHGASVIYQKYINWKICVNLLNVKIIIYYYKSKNVRAVRELSLTKGEL